MTQWNPNAPEVAGFEWFANTSAGDGIGLSQPSSLYMIGQRERSLAAETVETMKVRANSVAATGSFLMEIFEAGNEIPGAVTTSAFVPTADETVSNALNQAGSGLNLWQSVDTAIVDPTSYIKQGAGAAVAYYVPVFGGLAAWPANRRVLDIRATYIVSTSGITQGVTMFLDSGAGNLARVAPADPFNVFSGYKLITHSMGDINPVTGLPWTQANMVALGTAGADLKLRWTFDQWGGAVPPTFKMFVLYLEVDYCDETREAVGRGAVTFATPADVSVSLFDPNSGAANWAKGINTTYSIWLRPSPTPTTFGLSPAAVINRPTASFYMPTVERFDGDVIGGVRAPMQVVTPEEDTPITYRATASAGYRLTNLGTTEFTALFPLVGEQAGPVDSEMSNPFQAVEALAVFNDGGFFVQSSSQELTPVSTRAFTTLEFLARVTGEPGDLTVSAGVGMLVQLTPTQIREFPRNFVGVDGWHHVIVELATPWSLTGAVQVTIVFGALAGGPVGTDYYEIASVDGSLSGDSTYLGTTDHAYSGILSLTDFDIPVTLTADPPMPAEFNVALANLELPGSGQNCSIDDMEYAVITWDDLGDTAIAYTEVQRYDNFTEQWDTIGYGSVEDEVFSLNDYEPSRNIENCYRARNVGLSGGTSPWTPTVTLITDSFDRADAATLGSTDTGEAWFTYAGEWGIASNAAQVTAGATDRLTVIQASVRSGVVSAVVGTIEDGWGIAWWVESLTDYWYGRYNSGTTKYEIHKVVASVDTLEAQTIAGATAAPGTEVHATFDGDAGTVVLTIGPYNTSAVGAVVAATATGAGLWADSAVTAAARWASFSTTGPDACVTPQMDQCGLLLTSNVKPEKSVGYNWPTPSEFGFLDADRITMFPVFGRDGQIAFRPAEKLGDTFTATMTINFDEDPTPRAGRWVWDAILDIATDPDLPYVCVLDWDGRRWYAAVQPETGTRTEPARQYIADVKVTTLSFTPTPIGL